MKRIKGVTKVRASKVLFPAPGTKCQRCGKEFIKHDSVTHRCPNMALGYHFLNIRFPQYAVDKKGGTK